MYVCVLYEGSVEREIQKRNIQNIEIQKRKYRKYRNIEKEYRKYRNIEKVVEMTERNIEHGNWDDNPKMHEYSNGKEF